MSKLTEAAKEAIAIAQGKQPAARLTIKGHAYVPEQQLLELKAQRQLDATRIGSFQNDLAASRDEVKQVRAQFDDLKERIANTEFENQRMRGYIARVQEDDVVREELVTTGEPEGEKHLVPKRKHQTFEQPRQYSNFGEVDGTFHHGYNEEPRRKPKHWVTY